MCAPLAAGAPRLSAPACTVSHCIAGLLCFSFPLGVRTLLPSPEFLPLASSYWFTFHVSSSVCPFISSECCLCPFCFVFVYLGSLYTPSGELEPFHFVEYPIYSDTLLCLLQRAAIIESSLKGVKPQFILLFFPSVIELQLTFNIV